MVRNTAMIFLFIWVFVLVGCATSDEKVDSVENIGGTSGPEKADSIEDIVGTWHRVRPYEAATEFYCQFSDDGTYVCDGDLERINNKTPRLKGKYWFEGTQYFDQAVRCPADGAYEIDIQANGNFKYELIEDECQRRALTNVGRGSEVEGLIEWERVQ